MGIVTDDKMAGDARIDGHRIAVYHIMQYRDAGFDAEEIAGEFDLSVDEVKEAIAYAGDHKIR